MGNTGKNITKITPQICNLLMEIVDQKNRDISHSVLISEFGDQVANFLLKEGYLSRGHNVETYWLGSEDKDVSVEWNEKLKSFAYLSSSGKFITVKDEDLKTYEADIDKIVNFLAKEFDVLESSRTKQNQHIEELLYFVGNAQIRKKKVAIFFARQLNNNSAFKKVEEFFIKESTSTLPKLILTSSNPHCPESLKTGAKIISIPKLLKLANSKALFNIDYIGNVLSGAGEEAVKPDVYCSEDGGTLFVGDENWSIKGDKQRQIVKTMCNNHIQNPGAKMRWNAILDESDIETSSRFRDLFKNSSVKEAISYDNGFVWFKS